MENISMYLTYGKHCFPLICVQGRINSLGIAICAGNMIHGKHITATRIDISTYLKMGAKTIYES